MNARNEESASADSDPRLTGVDSAGTPYGVRIKRLRESRGISLQEMTSLIGKPYFEDWEWAEGDINLTASLSELAELASALGVPTWKIFEDAGDISARISPERISESVKNYLAKTRMDISQFEDQVGYEIANAVRNPNEILNWNLDCLRCVCAELGLNWLEALP